MGSRSKNNPHSGDGASPGKIFIGGLAKDATEDTFNQHFGKYGEITDSVIMKDRYSGQPRGFGFITYADASVVDKVIEDTHIINGKQVEIKRTIPKGAGGVKTKKIFVGGLPSTVTEDDFKDFFSKYGKVEEHQIIYDHETKRPRGFGFIVFESEEVVDEVLANGNRIDIAGTQVEIKKAEPKKSSNPPPALPAHGRNNFRARSFSDGLSDPYRGFDGGFGPGPYRTTGSFATRFGEYSAYNNHGNEFGDYGNLGRVSVGRGYRNEASIGYSSRYNPYSRGYSGMYDGSGVGGYGPGGGVYGNYGNSNSGYDNYDVGSGSGSSYGVAGGGFYSGRGGGYSNNSSRYHPYAK